MVEAEKPSRIMGVYGNSKDSIVAGSIPALTPET